MSEVDVFSYQDYRDYLKDFYHHKRHTDRKFSIRFFARRAGLKSENYLKVVMDGNRNLTARNLPKFVKGLGLGRTQAEYFEALVHLNQARDVSEKREYLEKLIHLKKKKTVLQLTRDQLDFYADWFNIVIFEMACQAEFNPQPEFISRRLKNKVSPKQVTDSLKMMIDLGILKIDENQRIMPVAARIGSSGEVPRDQIKKLHDSFIHQALEALHLQKEHEREIRSLTISLTKEQMPLFKEKLKDFQRELNTVFSSGEGQDVYQLNMQFFKLTKD